jgi:hypothetical protein
MAYTPDHYETAIPDVRNINGKVGIYDPLAGPDEYPIFSLSEQTAHLMAVRIIAQANGVGAGTVAAALQAKGI